MKIAYIGTYEPRECGIGTESTLAYLISHLTILEAFEEYYKTGH